MKHRLSSFLPGGKGFAERRAARAEGRAEDEAERIEQAGADAAARREIESGQFVEHSKVRAWLEQVGTPDERPMPKSWRE